MTISAIGASSVYAPDQNGATSKPGLRQQMSALFKDVQSGNLTAAKSDFDALSQLLGGSGGASAASGPFSALLGQVGAALSSGDITGAQSALSDFQSQGPSQALAQGQAADAAAGHHKHHHGIGKQQGIASLVSSIQNGDLQGAQDAYASLTDGSASGTATQGGTGTDVFSQLIASVGQSLANNDIAGAQQDLSGFAQSHRVGSAVSVTA
jgi:hypothetical protein